MYEREVYFGGKKIRGKIATVLAVTVIVVTCWETENTKFGVIDLLKTVPYAH